MKGDTESSEQEPLSFPRDVSTENTAYISGEPSKFNASEDELLKAVIIDEQGVATCEDPTTHSMTKLAVFTKNNATGEIVQAKLQKGQEGDTEVVLPEPETTKVSIVVERRYPDNSIESRGAYDRVPGLFGVSVRENDTIPLSLHETSYIKSIPKL